MFFILSKTLNYITMPLVIVVLLFIVSFLIRRATWKKRFLWTAFGLLLFFSNEFIANEVMGWWELEPTPFSKITKTYEWGIVLTGVTMNDRQPDDRVYFVHGADRVVHTVDLFKRGIIRKILISGGVGRLVTEARSEADELLKVMILMGVPADAIFLENESRNTHESAVAVKAMLKDDSSNKLLITSGFHMRRSLACFRNEDLSVEYFTTDFYSHPRYFTLDVLLVPKVEAVFIWQRVIKEWTGMIAYKMAGYI